MSEQEEIKISEIIHQPPWITSPTTFINTREFSREAAQFLKYGYYINAPKKSHAYREYWEEQTRRCIEGYEVGGVKISGRYYHYLNFTQIRAKTKDKFGRERKILTFPNFLDIDYYYYWEIEHAMDEGKGLCVAKARRKGFSYKNSQLCAYDFNFVRDSVSVIGAYLEEYSQATMRMALDMLNFMNKETAWTKRRNPDKQNFVKARYKKFVNGQEVWAGKNSELYTLTFHSNTSAAIGKSINLMLWEEAGKWPNIIDSYDLTLPTFVDGDVTTGFWIVFGTGGDMDSGASAGFEKLFNNPIKYHLRAYNMSDYDPEMDGEAGFFVDDTWYKPPYINEDGVSNRLIARDKNLEKRAQLEKGADTTQSIDNFLTQYPLYPKEAFLVTVGAYLPAKQIFDQISRVTQDKKLANLGIKGVLEEDKGKVKFTPNEKLTQAPYPFDSRYKQGCVVIYEHPEKVGKDENGKGGEIPHGLYLAATDPYMHDKAESSDSYGSTFIYKKFYRSDKTHDILVAEYTGRPETTEDYYDTVRKLLVYYNAKCMYENQFKDMKTHFHHRQCLHLLAQQPAVIKDIIPKSTVKRGYGVHMPAQMKSAAVIYLRDWLLEEKAPGHTNLQDIYSLPLLQEMVKFNFDGNFDRVSAMLIMMIYIQENRRIQMNEILAEKKKDGFFAEFFEQTGFKN
jgi:hypothetical protein